MNEILETTQYVVQNSKFVKIDLKKVSEFANNFPTNDIDHWLSCSPFNFFTFSEEQKLNFLFIFHSICFSFWGEPKWTIKYKNKKYDGSLGMLMALYKCIKKGFPILDFKFYKNIEKKDFFNILKGSIEIPLF